MIRFLSITIFLFVFNAFMFSQQNEVEIPYTQADRDRMVRVETRLDNLEREVREGQASLRDQISELRVSINGLTYSIFGLVGVLVALVIWDRRTLVRPVTAEL